MGTILLDVSSGRMQTCADADSSEMFRFYRYIEYTHKATLIVQSSVFDVTHVTFTGRSFILS